MVSSSRCPPPPRTPTDGIERREFIKKTGATVLAAGFPGIISGQTVTNAIKVGLVGAGGRGSGAAAQALTADPDAELTAVADIDEAIVERAASAAEGQREVRIAGEDRPAPSSGSTPTTRSSTAASTSSCSRRRRGSGRST